MKQELKLIVRNVMGEKKIYPYCRASKDYMMQQRDNTFSEADIKNLESNGYKIKFIEEFKSSLRELRS